MKRIALCFCALLLAGCTMFHKQDAAVAACPAVGLVKGAAFFPVTAGAAPHQAAGDLAASGTIQSFSADCKYRKTGGVDVNLTVNFAGQREAKGQKLGGHSFPYFVAVISPDDQILQRQVFSTKVDFDNKTGAGVSSEDHKILIPLKDYKNGPAFRIAAGFALTAQQATYNKDNHAD